MNERDTHFQGSARLLYSELYPLFRELFAANLDRNTYRAESVERTIKLTLVRHDYDIMEHTMLYAPAVPVPDMTE